MTHITAIVRHRGPLIRAAACIALAGTLAAAAPSFADPQPEEDASSGTDASAGAATTPAASTDAPAAAPKGDVHDAQNPIAKLISIPVQFNSYHDVGPYGGTENLLLVEPVVPFKLNDDWNLITRTIIPFLWQPQLSPTLHAQYELGNINPQLYFSPSHSGQVIWGVGPEFSIPTATGIDRYAWSNHVGYGIDSVVLTFQGHWTLGLLASNLWTKTEHQINGRTEKALTVNPFVYYNLPKGWYFVYSGVTTADWQAPSKDRWTVPLGGGMGRLFKLGSQLINARAQFLNNVERPAYAPSWQAQLQIQFLFPRH